MGGRKAKGIQISQPGCRGTYQACPAVVFCAFSTNNFYLLKYRRGEHMKKNRRGESCEAVFLVICLLIPCLIILFPITVFCASDVQINGTLDILGTVADGIIFPDGTTQTTAATSSLYQHRVTGTCPTGQAINVIYSGGSVSCQAVGTGTVTSVNTGTGLTGGPITGSGTISIATGAITASQLADSTVATAKLADGAVTAAKLANASISTAKLADSSITAAKLNIDADVNMHDKDLLLRGDAFHGLGWYGSGKLFAGVNVNGPVLYGGSGGALGSTNGGQKTALTWDQNGNLTASNDLTMTNTLWMGSAAQIYMKDRELYLRNDTNHGIGWYGQSKQFAGNSFDGPVVYGYSGGALGTSTGGQKVALAWNSSGNVSVTGQVESQSGGFKFPDGTVQTTASAPIWSQTLPAAERFVLVMGNVAVLDRETGLVWQRATDSTLRNWYDATSYCYGLYLGGRMGWRVPSIEQLTSLVDPSQYPTLPAGNPFTGSIAAPHWSSTDYIDSGHAWYVYFSDGHISANAKNYDLNVYVRCVRGGQ